MSILAAIGAIFSAPVIETVKFLYKEVSGWMERRDQIREAETRGRIADLEAKTQLAAYRAAAEVEWDLTWAGQAQTSWKDEYILILWSIPTIIFIPCLFIPPARDYAMETLQFMQTINPQIVEWYLAGWGIIFGATYGFKGAIQTMVGDRAAKVAEVFANLPDDIPKTAVEAAQRVAAKVAAASSK